MGAGDRGNQQVIRPNGFSLLGKIRSNPSLFLRATIVEGQARKRSEESIKVLQVFLNPLASPCTIYQLGLDNAL